MEEEGEVSCEYVCTPVVIHNAHLIVVCMCVHVRFLLSVLCTDTHTPNGIFSVSSLPSTYKSVLCYYRVHRDIGTCLHPEIRGSMIDDKQFSSSIDFLVLVIYSEDHNLQIDTA